MELNRSNPQIIVAFLACLLIAGCNSSGKSPYPGWPVVSRISTEARNLMGTPFGEELNKNSTSFVIWLDEKPVSIGFNTSGLKRGTHLRITSARFFSTKARKGSWVIESKVSGSISSHFQQFRIDSKLRRFKLVNTASFATLSNRHFEHEDGKEDNYLDVKIVRSEISEFESYFDIPSWAEYCYFVKVSDSKWRVCSIDVSD